MSTIKNIDKLKEALTAIECGIAPCEDGFVLITPLNFLEFETENIFCWITIRPSYCDRGKYLWNAQSKDITILEIDSADLFPRYFFNIEALGMEIESWLRARGQTEIIDIQIKHRKDEDNKS